MTSELTALQRATAGDVLLPGTAAYEAVRRPPLGRFHDARPQVIVRCRTEGDVVEAIAFARRHGLELAVRAGGHCFAGRSSTDGLLVDVGPIDAVHVADDVVTVGAGARLAGVYDALDARGLTIAAGCGPTVGIAGLALGGGLGILGRRHGLTSDQLVSARVVLADGRVVDCDERRHGDLFWALRGAGGCQFGVLTELTLRTVPAPAATTLHLQWPHEDGPAVAGAWQAWSPDAPAELAASLLVTAGADPAVPPRVHVFGAMLGTREEATALLEALVAAAARTRRRRCCTSCRTGRPSAASPSTPPVRRPRRTRTASPSRSSSGNRSPARRSPPCSTISPPSGPTASCGRSTSRPGAAPTTACVRTRPPSRTAPSASCSSTTSPSTPAPTPRGAGARATGWPARGRWCTRGDPGASTPTSPTPSSTTGPRAYHAGNLERLTRVKAAYDPGNLFRSQQSLR